MTYELLMTIAMLCQQPGTDDSPRYLAELRDKCQQQLIKCAELTPSPIKLAECVKGK